MVSLHYTEGEGVDFTHRPPRGSRFARNNDRSTINYERKKKVGWPFATPLSAVIFLRLSRRTGEEKKEGGPDKSMNSPFLFSNASWNNYRFICPSVGSIVVSPLLSLFSKTRVGKRWLCEEI